jgi:hypothetical protein
MLVMFAFGPSLSEDPSFNISVCVPVRNQMEMELSMAIVSTQIRDNTEVSTILQPSRGF